MPLVSALRRMLRRVAVVFAVAMLLGATTFAAGPRWTTGWAYFQSNGGSPVVWYTTQPQYFTDPGDLSPYVNHAAADALVAAAAATWNDSRSSLTLSQGGALNQHVSGANVYLGSSGPVFPADVQASNYAAKQIAVIYDADGSVTDTLLGGGASDPSNCRQSAVTESVDSIATNGTIQHALIVLNGRCTGSAAAAQLEMKYKLIRAFGRVLGLGWSQLNDNVFTGQPAPTSQQAQNWPIMHPIDLLCGPYAYQCILQPFTLRTDDIASLVSMYPVTTAGNGKTLTATNAAKVWGFVSFPNGQPMEGLLVSIRRFHFGPGYTDAFDLTSSVTGYSFQQVGGNPVKPKAYTLADSSGSTNTYSEGYYSLGWVPVPATDYFDNMTVTTSAINPLYTGQYAVGPYAASQVTPSGPSMTNTAYVVNTQFGAQLDMTSTGAPATCGAAGDGTEGAPLAVAVSGIWAGTLCGYQHTAWSSLAVKAGRSLTMEVTAVDEQGYATAGKMLPVIGVWDSNDGGGQVPTMAAQAAALNASALGMTNLRVSTATARTMRIAVADQRGDGRPDFGYNARVLYADAVSPAMLPANGGVVTITGMGFRPGNTVTVNGIAATVSNWTSTAITLVAPAITGPLAADVLVTDLSTGGQSTMTGALTYSQNALPDVLTVVGKPADGGFVGSVGAPNFKVQVMLPDGTTPAVGTAVTFASGTATFGACSGAATCVVTTDSAGIARSPVTPASAGTVTLTATVGSASVSATFTALAIPVDRLSVVSMPSGTVYATLPAATPFRVKVTLPDGTTAAAGVSVVLTAGNAGLGGCSGAASCTLVADASGVVSTTVTPAAAGVVSLLATAGGGTVSASFGATALPADVLRVVTKPADGSYVGRVAGVPFAVQAMLGDNATAASGAAVTVTASGGTLGACGAGSCVLTADAGGFVSTTVTPSAAGTVGLMAAAGGGTVSASFVAVAIPPDSLSVVTKPANGSYVGRVAVLPLSVRTVSGETGALAAGVAVTVSATGATLGGCSGVSSCVLTADGTGTISTSVTPSGVGTVSLSASEGGGTVSATFTAAAVPPDTLVVVTKPANGSYVNRTAAIPFAVQVALGDTGGAAAGVAVTVSVSNAVLNACGASTCTLTADSGGVVSTTVKPLAAGAVGLSASAGGGSIAASFTAVAIPANTLTVVTKPANGSYVGRTSTLPFAVQVVDGETGGPASGVSVSVSATNAVLTACGAASCTMTADAVGAISTTVIPSAVGSVGLSASAGGGTVSASFTAAMVPPDTLRVLSQPANGSYAGAAAAIAFSVEALLGDTGAPANGASVTLTATNATLGCGGSTCTMAASVTGTVSTTVTPASPGTVGLSANAGGGTISTSFSAVAMPPDALQVISAPANGTYVGSPAALPFSVSILRGDGVTPAAGVSVTLTATGATFDACGLSTCTVAANSLGTVAATVTATVAGSVTLSASAGGGTASVSFTAQVVPATLEVISAPADHSMVNQVAATPFVVQARLGLLTNGGIHALASRVGAPAAGQVITLTAVGARLNACGLPTCVLTADSTGTVATTVTPLVPGAVTLLAAGGGASLSSSFAADPPPDVLHVASTPANGSYANRAAATSFAVQVLLADGTTPRAGASVTLTAVGATLGACGLASCVVVADASGMASSAVTPLTPGTVQLGASAGGGAVSASFTAAAVPPHGLYVVAQPVNGSYVGRTASAPFTVQVALGDTGGPAAGVSVTVSAANATLTACGASTCTLTADSTGTVFTSVSPIAVGSVTLTAAAGGGTVSTTFTAAAVPPHSLHVVSQPANGSYAARVAGVAYSVQALLGDTGGPATGSSATVSAVNATFGACGASTCTITADANGTVSTTVTPLSAGLVSLTASAGGGTVSSSFTAAAVPPDTLHLVSQPANGTYAARVASSSFAVQVLLGDTGGTAAGASVTVTAVGGTLGACGWPSCVLTADSTGSISTPVTPSAVGTVLLTASAGGGTLSVSFNAVAVPPDSLRVVSQPGDGAYVGSPAGTRFAVQALLGDTGAPAVGASVTLTAGNAQLGSCVASPCVLTADATGTVSTLVTPLAAGAVTLMAAAGGGTVSASFNAVPYVLQVLSQPSGTIYATVPSPTVYTVQVLLPDGRTPAAGAAVTLTAKRATLGVCGGTSTCVLWADASGFVSSTVTPLQAGTFVLKAAAGGTTIYSTLPSVALPPDMLSVVSAPSGAVYIGTVAATRFAVRVLLGDGLTAASNAQVTLSASGATLGTCGASSCVVTADAAGSVSTTVTPSAAGTVTLNASAGGGATSATFMVTPDVVRVVTSPVAGTYTGSPAAAPFTVQVLLGDGVTPVSETAVTVQASGVMFGACGLSVCALTTDSQGMASTSVTATGPGTITLNASSNGGAAMVSFVAVAPPNVLSVVSAPADGTYAGRSSTTPFTVRVSLGDATNGALSALAARLPASGVAVTLSATGATLDACGRTSCVLTTDASGLVSTTLTPIAAGPVTLAASAGGGTVSSSFTAVPLPNVLRMTSVPANGSFVGRVAANSFMVRVYQSDGVTAVTNVSVTMTAVGATFGACGQSTCVVPANLTGKASTTVTPTSAGPVTLTANSGGGTLSASFTAVNPPDILRVASAPANGADTGRAAAAPFSVQVMLGDGATPAAGVSVTLSAGNASLGVCGLASCTMIADASGLVSTTVTPLVAGTVTLSASAGGGTASASFAAVDPVRTLSFARSMESVATGAAMTWMPVVTLFENGVPAAGVAVTWTGSQGLAVAARTSVTGVNGAATVGVTVGPLASGAAPAGTACAWAGVCATFGARAVDDSAWRLVVVSGDAQTVRAGDTLQPLVLRAVDDAGNWLGGVTVQVSQMVRGYVVCPPTGRCPVAPVLSKSSATVVTDSDGVVSITPLQSANAAETTGIVAVAGGNGYLSVTLSKVP